MKFIKRNKFDFFKKISKVISEIIIKILNFILLSIVYIFGIGITYFLLKISKIIKIKKFIRNKIKKNNIDKNSYWIKITNKKEDIYRMF